MTFPSKAEWLAWGRNIGSAVSPLLGLLVLWGVLTPDQQTAIMTDIGHVKTGAHELWIGLSGIWIIVVPLLLAWWAKTTAKPSNQVKSAAIAIRSGAVQDVAMIPTGAASPISSSAASSPADLAKAAIAAAITPEPPKAKSKFGATVTIGSSNYNVSAGPGEVTLGSWPFTLNITSSDQALSLFKVLVQQAQIAWPGKVNVTFG